MTITGFTFGDGSTNSVQTTWSATCPTVAAGDTLVVVASTNGSAPILSVSGGSVSGGTWTSLSPSNPDVTGTNIVSNVWVATATGSSTGTSITITSNTTGRLIGAGVAVPGFTTSGAVIALTQQTSASTSIPFPSVTVTSAGSQLLGLAVLRVGSTTTATLTAPSGSTKAAESASNFSSSAEFTDVIVATNATVGTGSQSLGTGTASTSVADAPIYTVALAPGVVNNSQQVPSSSVGVGSDAAAPTSGQPVPSAAVGVGSDAATVVSSSSPAVDSAAVAARSDATSTGTSTAIPSAGVGAGSDVGSVVAFSPPPPPPPIISPTARWSWAMGAWNGLPTLALADATKRSMRLRLTGTSEVTFDLDGSTAEAAAMQELTTDVWCIRDGFTLFRGRLGGSTHTADGTTYSISYTVGDYRALLQRRLLFDTDTLTYTSTEQSAIAWGLISTTQGHTGGGLSLSNAAATTGTARTITYPAGQSVGQAIEQLSLMDGGFNWDVVPTTGQVGQAFTVWPSRGESAQRVVDFPGRVAKFTRAVDPGTYANAVRETGNTGIAAVTLAASDIATRPEGRWDVQSGDTSLLDAASVTSRAAYDLASRQQIVPTYTVTLQPGSWGGPPDIWLGDSVLLVIAAGPVQTAVNLRVFEIDIDLDDADNETVTLTLSALDPFKRARSRQYEFRLQQLERR